MTKKILLIIGILIIGGLAVFLILGESPAETGESRVGFSFRDYFPFGGRDGTINLSTSTNSGSGLENQNDEGRSLVATNQPIPRLRKLSGEPVAGAVIFEVGTTTFIRYVEKGTGNVYEARGDSSNITRLTNTTIPKIIKAFWLPNGSGFLAQTLVPESEIVETSFVSLIKVSTGADESLTPFTTRISKLPTGIKDLAVSGDSKKILYYSTDGRANFYTSNPDGTAQALVLSHPLSEWIIRYWQGGSSALVQSKESSSFPPYFYLLDTANKSLSRTANPMTEILQNVFTLTDKCSLPVSSTSYVYCAVAEEIPSTTYVDDWYKGLVSTSDSIRKIDIRNNVFYNTSNLSIESGQKIDVVDMSVSKGEKYLTFRNKVDGFLWLLRIED